MSVISHLCVRCQVRKTPGALAATLLLKGIVSSVQKAAWCLEEAADEVTALPGPLAGGHTAGMTEESLAPLST